MADLTDLFVALGFKNVRTYVQSGNVVFETSRNDTAKLVSVVEEKLRRTFGAEIRVVAKSAAEFISIMRKNPLATQHPNEIDKLHVTFLSCTPDKKLLTELTMPKAASEQFVIVGSEIFLFLPDGYGRTKLTNNAFEKKLGCGATTRNWKTVRALAQMTGEQV